VKQTPSATTPNASGPVSLIPPEHRPQEQAALHDDPDGSSGSHSDFTRMDESTHEQWHTIALATLAHQPQVGKRMIEMLRSFDGVRLGFGVDQLHHMLQTATMAKRANASDELVLCALLHDVGKYVSIINHGQIAAEMLKPYVSRDAYHIVRTHQDFQGRHYYQHFGMEQNLRERHRDEPWFDLAQVFTDEWDQAAFDPHYKVLPLGEFEPLVHQFFGRYPGS